MTTDGDYFDGRSSVRRPVVLTLRGDRLHLDGDGLELAVPLREVTVAAPLGSLPSAVYLPDGGKCEFASREFACNLEQHRRRGRFFRGVHRWENSLGLAFVALAVTVALVVGFVQFGIPQLATRAAYAIPPATETILGRETLEIIDRTLLEPTALAPARQAELEILFSGVVAALDPGERSYRLELRRSPRIGANAFALPGGTVIMTDELIALAGHDQEIAAVLAHEVGHVRHRHALRQVIQGSAVALVVATLTGDVFSASSLAATLPTMLVDADFSRDMEREADDVALEYLAGQGYGTEHFAAILTRLEQAHAEKHGPAAEGGVTDYLSSHPATRERIARLRSR